MINLIEEENFNNAVKKGLEQLSLKNKTKTFWKRFLNECLLHWNVLEKSILEIDKYMHKEIINNQLLGLKESNLEPSDSYMKSFISNCNDIDIINCFLEIFLEKKNSKIVRKIISKKSTSISSYYINDIVALIGINEAFKFHLVDDQLLEKHLSEFNKSFIVKYGQGRCSYKYLSQILSKDESNYIDIKNISHDRRPHISPESMVGYKNGGVFVDKFHYSGASVYFPYGLAKHFSNALKKMNDIISKEMDSTISDIEKLKKSNHTDDMKKQFISHNHNLIKDLSDLHIISNILESALAEI